VPPPTAANRLRVSLSALRRVAGTHLSEKGDLLRLDVQTDLATLTNLLRSLRDEVDEGAALEALRENLPALSQTVLPDFDSPWVQTSREAWTATALFALHRGVELAVRQGDWWTVIQCAEAGFHHDPYDELLWEAYLRSGAYVGDRTAVAEHFNVARKQLTETGGDFSKEICELAKALKSGSFPLTAKGLPELTPREIELSARVVAVILNEKPDLARTLFGARSAYFEEVNVRDVGEPLLQKLIATGDPETLGWQQCALNLVSIRAVTGVTGMDDLIAQILAVTTDVTVRSTTLAYRSFIELVGHRFDESEASIRECIRLLTDNGQADEAKTFSFNLATILINQGNIEDGIAVANEAIRYFESQTVGVPQVRVSENEFAVVQGLCCLGRYEEAWPHAEKAIKAVIELRFEPHYGSLGALGSSLDFRVNRNGGFFDTLVRGLKAAYRADNVFIMLRGLEAAAGIFHLAGRAAMAQATLQYCEDWRGRHGLRRLPSHEYLLAGLSLGEPRPGKSWPDPRTAISAVIAELRLVAVDHGYQASVH
jgi:DNA-binding SARP family transcriptional activator